MLVHEIGLVFVFAAVLGVIFKWLKQPLIPAYVLAGMLISPLAFNLVTETEGVMQLSEIAIVSMLFVIGIEMDLGRLKSQSLVAVGGGILQVSACFATGFFAAKWFGLTATAACYLGFAVAFSSTMVAVKVLSDKRDLHTLYGRIAIGILVMQDILAIFALSILATLNSLSFETFSATITLAAGLILITVFVLGQYVFPQLMKFVARDRETLFVTTMGLLFLIGFYAEQQRLSMGIGSFLAGLSMASLAYQHEIIGELKALKSFFTVLFFATLGLGISPNADVAVDAYSALYLWDALSQYGGFMAIFGLLTIVVKPLLVLLIVTILGYDRSTAFTTALSLGQLSEFSLVLLAGGISLGALDPSILPPMIVVTVFSMTISSYLMKYDLAIYRRVGPYLSWLQRLAWVAPKNPVEDAPADGFQVLLVGRDRLGRVIEEVLRRTNARYIVVDSNPDVIAELHKEQVPYVFGDINNHEVLDRLNFAGFKTVISSLPDLRDNELLIRHVGESNAQTNFIGIVDSRRGASDLYQAGAHYVIVPYMLAGSHLIHSRGEQEVSLDVLLCGTEALRARGTAHRAGLFENPATTADQPV